MTILHAIRSAIPRKHLLGWAFAGMRRDDVHDGAC
jgi:hypothetical protein